MLISKDHCTLSCKLSFSDHNSIPTKSIHSNKEKFYFNKPNKETINSFKTEINSKILNLNPNNSINNIERKLHNLLYTEVKKLQWIGTPSHKTRKPTWPNYIKSINLNVKRLVKALHTCKHMKPPQNTPKSIIKLELNNSK